MTAPLARDPFTGGAPCSRRAFVGTAASCVAHLALMSALAPAATRALWAAQARFPVVAQEPWGRLERIAEGIWALTSTPLGGDRTTLCNGGIIAGRSGVLVVEAFGTDAGARWMAAQARALTGRGVTHVVVTHYHGDHTAGVRGALETPGAALHATHVTRDLTVARNQNVPVELLQAARELDGAAPSTIDLGGRRVIVAPASGHTDSDVSVRVEDPAVVFCGDLVWNGMFPNYVDARPTALTQSVRALRALDARAYVPGHGTVATPAELDGYLVLLDSVEAAARRGFERGQSVEEAGAEYKIPLALGEWTLFNPGYFVRAIGAWYKEIRPG